MRRRARLLELFNFGPALALAFVASCHREASRSPSSEEEGQCSGARCVELAEAAMMYKEYDQARDPLTEVCERGDGFQCFRLAELHHTGKGGAVDLVKATEYYEKSCTADYAEGCERRSDLAREGQGGPDIELQFAIKACAGGRPLGCIRAGEQLQSGRGVERDTTQAVEYFQKGCTLGEVDGCVSVGDLLFTPKATPEAKARGFAAFNSACRGHSGYGCIKAAIGFYNGKGTPKDVVQAKNQFDKACQFAEEDGCRLAKAIEEAKGEPVVLDLTTKAEEIGKDGLVFKNLTCRMLEWGPEALDDVMTAVAPRKQALDECVKTGLAVKVSWESEHGKVRAAEVVDHISKKTAKCIAWALRKARVPTTGTCQGIVMLGDPEAAAKSFGKRKQPKFKHIKMGKEDE